MKKEDHVLALYNSSSAIRWAFKSIFGEVKQASQFISGRKLATILIDTEMHIYRQHFKGIRDFIMESVSRDHYLTYNQLTCFLIMFSPTILQSNSVSVHFHKILLVGSTLFSRITQRIFQNTQNT